MKHLEEKILAYLDGSLGATEREDLLRTISESPEGRRMLEEHLRVSNLLTKAAKPVSAPLETQRALAGKIPMMATILPYLAAEQPARRAVAWYRSSKYIAAALGGLAIVGGGLWYALSNSGESQNLPIAANQEVAVPHTMPAQTAPNSTSSAPSAAVPGAAAPGTAPGLTVPSSSAKNSTADHSVQSNHKSASEIAAPKANTGLSSLSIAKTTQHHAAQNNSGNAVKIVENTPVATHDETKLNQSQQNLATTNEPETAALNALSISSASARRNEHYDLPHFLSERQSSSYIPVRAFVNFKTRNALLPSPSLSKRTRDSNTGILSSSERRNGFEAGIDYELSPWVSLGLRGGQADFYQLQGYHYQEVHGDLDQWVSDAFLNRVQAYWTGLALRYEVNPQDKLRVAAAAVGGVAFIQRLSPMGMVELSSTYSIFNFLALEAAISVDQTSIAAAPDTRIESKPGTMGFVTAGPIRDKSPVTAFGARFGLVFHP